MTKQSNEQTFSLGARIRISFARWLLRCSRRWAFRIAPELREAEEIEADAVQRGTLATLKELRDDYAKSIEAAAKRNANDRA